MAAELPPQSEYPDVLYRVTSSSTFCLSSKPYDLPSPARSPDGPQLDLAVEFRDRSEFGVAVRCHLTAARTPPDGRDFYSPFISTTTSLRYAISIAKLHEQRGGRAITITVIDCRSLEASKPVWNAFSLADLFGVTGGNGSEDFKNEYIIFDGLEGTSSNSAESRYSDIELHLESLMPALQTILDFTKKRRFANLLEDVPPVTSFPTAKDADAAYELAQRIAPPQARMSVMMSLPLLQHRASSDVSGMHLAVVMCVSSKVSFSDSELLAHFAVVTSAKLGSKQIFVRDFLGQQYSPTIGSTTPETRDLHTCVLTLGGFLHLRQEQELKQLFAGLSSTAFILRKCLKPKGIVERIVKHCDRGLDDHESMSNIGARHLSNVFLDLRQAVQEAVSNMSCTSPLLKVYTYLSRASREAECAEGKTVSKLTVCVARLISTAGIQ